MINSSRADKATEYFKSGYNCAQAVAMAFSDLLDMDEKTAARLTSGFGGGVGRLREVCGSVLGMTFVMSALYGYDDTSDYEAKKRIYADIQSLANKFKEENGSLVCRELLGLSPMSAPSPAPEKRTEEFYKKRPCAELVYISARNLEEYINAHPYN